MSDTTKLNWGNPATLSALTKGDLANALTAATPGGIELQEAMGQKDLLAHEMLPREIQFGSQADFEALGFVFGKPIDDLFQQATLPPGWKKEPSSHSMWSYIVDETGQSRVAIFYKAAFYDRKAFMFIERIDREKTK